MVTKGKTLVTTGKTLLTAGKTLVIKGKTLVTAGETLVTISNQPFHALYGRPYFSFQIFSFTCKHQAPLLAGDSSSISPNVVCLLLFVVYQVDKLLANCLLTSCLQLTNCLLNAC